MSDKSTCGNDGCNEELVVIDEEVEIRIGGSSVDHVINRSPKLLGSIASSTEEKTFPIRVQAAACPECGGSILIPENIPFGVFMHEEGSSEMEAIKEIREDNWVSPQP